MEENEEEYRLVDAVAHPVDENPEDHIGVEMKDPWDDLEQTDWPSGIQAVES